MSTYSNDPWATMLAGDPLTAAHATFRKWLSKSYDLAALDVVLAAAAVERLDGDPLWVLNVSGSGNAKTETVGALAGAGAVPVSTITSEGALLSATSQKERAKDATGGLLRMVEPRGLLVIKDVTSILSANRETRGQVLGALREVYDGRWDRNVGTDGGRTLSWEGRIGVVGAVTTAWDRAHSVIAAMGDRFVLIRTDSRNDRREAARQALSNTGSEKRMRQELLEAVGTVMSSIDTDPLVLTADEVDLLISAADVVSLSRTAVEFSQAGEVEMAHDPEAATRLARQLQQVARGAYAVGADRETAVALAIRVARDSMPPLRLAILDDLAANPGSAAHDIYPRVDKPKSSVRRQVDALHALGVIRQVGETMHNAWTFDLATDIDPGVLTVPADLSDGCQSRNVSKGVGARSNPPLSSKGRVGSDKSGFGSGGVQ